MNHKNKKETNPPKTKKTNFNKRENNIQKQFLRELNDFEGYPFDEYSDKAFFLFIESEYPGIDILRELDKKLAWWKKHPDALKNGKFPRGQLCEWFEKEYEYQKRKKQ
ncbi:MAG: hypothetical protein ACOC5T_06025 [Elusimicrobiota bacterium]